MMMFPHDNSVRREQGFSLIETLVTVTIFSVILIAVGGVFVQIAGFQRRGLGAQQVQENALFALELIAREIRVSVIPDQNLDCPDTLASTLSITHPVNGAVEYSITPGGVLRRTAGGIVTDLSSEEVTFTRLTFCGKGIGADQEQARIMIIARVRDNTQATDNRVEFDLQTTIASRNLENE